MATLTPSKLDLLPLFIVALVDVTTSHNGSSSIDLYLSNHITALNLGIKTKLVLVTITNLDSFAGME
jgi:hypothetical protein